jgi:hypothetical protein
VRGTVPTALSWAAAVLLVASGLIHLHLWDIAYRHIKTLGPLFLVQTVAAFVVAVALVALRRAVVEVAALLLMVGTMVGFALVTTVGLFGFTLHEITKWAYLAMVAEIAAVVALGAVIWLLMGGARTSQT